MRFLSRITYQVHAVFIKSAVFKIYFLVPDDYQSRMLKNFKDSGLDFIIIGFYQSIQFGDMDTSELFTSLYEYVISFQSAAAILFGL